MNRLDQAKAFAQTEGYQVMVLPDTSDVLSQARAAIANATGKGYK